MQPQRKIATWSVLWLTLVLWAGLSGTSGIEAQEPGHTQGAVDTSRWQCRLCPYREGWFGALDLGAGYVNGGSLKFADYRGLDQPGLFPEVDGELHYRDERDRYLDVRAQYLGIDSRLLDLRAGVRGRYQIRLGYREIPKYRGFAAATVYSAGGGGQLGLPDHWQKSFTTAGMTALDSSLKPASLDTLRRTLTGGITLKFAQQWTYAADFWHETRQGSRPFGAGLYLVNTSHFPVPVDFTTDRFDMGLQYRGERAHLRLGFAGSWFDSGRSSITWENPFSSAPQNELLRAALEPDNEFYQFSLQGAFAPRPGLRFSGGGNFGRMQQNSPLLPYSINPDFGMLTLPRDGQSELDIEVLNLTGRLIARLAKGLDLNASAKIDQRDNDSPVDGYTIVITDLVPGGERLNRPYSFRRENYRLELSYRAVPGISVRAGARQEDYERSLQSVLKTDERSYWGELNFNRWAAAQLRLKLETSDRDASPYIQVDQTGLIENPLMRKFHFADRDRERVVAEISVVPDQPWSLTLSWSRAQDGYSNSLVGLQDSDDENFSVDVGVSLTPGIHLSANASRDRIASQLSGFNLAAPTPWQAATEDRVTTLGVSISGQTGQRLQWGLDWVQSTAKGRIQVTSQAPPQAFPKLRTQLGNVRAYVSFTVDEHWAWKLMAEHESLDSADWQIDGLGAAGMASVLTFGGISPRYAISVIRLQASYRF